MPLKNKSYNISGVSNNSWWNILFKKWTHFQEEILKNEYNFMVIKRAELWNSDYTKVLSMGRKWEAGREPGIFAI